MARTSVTLVEEDDGKSLDLRVGESIGLRLHENASTGYRWAFEARDEAAVDVLEEGYAGRPSAVGSGGFVQWTLHARAPGTTHIKLKLWRVWQGDSSVRKRFELTLNIRP